MRVVRSPEDSGIVECSVVAVVAVVLVAVVLVAVVAVVPVVASVVASAVAAVEELSFEIEVVFEVEGTELSSGDSGVEMVQEELEELRTVQDSEAQHKMGAASELVGGTVHLKLVVVAQRFAQRSVTAGFVVEDSASKVALVSDPDKKE
jgi:hypothetical protein